MKRYSEVFEIVNNGLELEDDEIKVTDDDVLSLTHDIKEFKDVIFDPLTVEAMVNTPMFKDGEYINDKELILFLISALNNDLVCPECGKILAYVKCDNRETKDLIIHEYVAECIDCGNMYYATLELTGVEKVPINTTQEDIEDEDI